MITIITLSKKLEGWNTVEDVERKLGIRKSTAYFYLHKLGKSGHIVQKVKKPRGTMYLVSTVPVKYRHYGAYEDTDIVAPSLEFSKEKMSCEQKVAFFLKEYREENNRRFLLEAKKFARKIKDWKLLYKFLKAYKTKEEFKLLYSVARTEVRMPKMPRRYKKLLLKWD